MNAGPVHVSGEVLSSKQVGAYRHVTLVAPGVAERFRPGSLVSVTVGGLLTDRVMRRTVPIQRARAGGQYGGTVEVVLEPAEPGQDWLAAAVPGSRLDVIGPLGRPFALPTSPVPCLLVGYDAAAAPLAALAERLRARSCEAHVLVAAAEERRLLGVLETRRTASSLTVATQDGSVGIRGEPLDLLPGLLARTRADVVYAAGPIDLLRGVASAAEEHGSWSQVALDVARDLPLPCATGLCHACPVPVVGADGVARSVRACFEGPVLRGDQLRWDQLVTCPAGRGEPASEERAEQQA